MRRGFAPIIAVAIVTAFIVGALASFFFLKFRITTLNRQVLITPSPTQTTIPAPSTTTDKTANWKTYTNINQKFSFKHPSDTKIETDSEGNVLLSKWGPTQEPDTGFYDGISIRFMAESLNGQNLRTIAEKELSNATNADVIKPLSETKLNGNPAYTFRVRGLGEHTFTFVGYNDRYARIIDGTVDPTNQGFIKLSNQILSTFKFLE